MIVKQETTIAGYITFLNQERSDKKSLIISDDKCSLMFPRIFQKYISEYEEVSIMWIICDSEPSNDEINTAIITNSEKNYEGEIYASDTNVYICPKTNRTKELNLTKILLEDVGKYLYMKIIRN